MENLKEHSSDVLCQWLLLAIKKTPKYIGSYKLTYKLVGIST